MTTQTAFNKIVKHLKKQGWKKSAHPEDYVGDEPNCLYRGPDGMSCAIGCLIKDKDYDRSMEGQEVDNLIDNFSLTYLEEIDLSFLSDMQYFHDGGMSNPAEELDAIADTYGLKLGEIK